MKALFLVPTLKMGGAERFTSSLGNWMAAQGHDVTIVTVDNRKSFYDIDDRVEVIQMNLENNKRSIYNRISKFYRQVKSIRMLILDRKTDLVICLNYSLLLRALMGRAFIKVKVIGTERSNPQRLPRSGLRRIMRNLISIFADGYLFQTKRAQQLYPTPTRRKSTVIPNAIYNKRIYGLKAIPQKEKFVYAAGRLEQPKGFDTLIRAFGKLIGDFPDYKLVIYGDGSQREKLYKIISNLGLENDVTLPGAVNNLEERISNGHMFVLSSRYEGMPNALLEAIALGLPCVSTRCRMGPEEIIEDNENGLLVDVDDVDGLYSAMRRIIVDKNLSKKLSTNALKSRESYSLNTIGMKHIQYFEEKIRGEKWVS